ncbi:MAG: MATE family efflux transporter [Clostridiaceae bacterium]|nr:MATE family efflux transporter [Clostridiaceae bacterium]
MNQDIGTNSKKQLSINICASFVAFIISISINFFLSRYIVKNVGADAYGFVDLSNNLLTYFSLLTIALNSMSSRFISIAYFKGNKIEADEYYSSTFFSNLLISIIFAPILIVSIINIDKFIQIPSNLLSDVQLLMTFMAINFIISLIATNFSISYYIKNKLYISSIVNIIGYIIRAVLLFLLFRYCRTNIMYIGLVTVIVTVFTQLLNIKYKRKYTPELKVERKRFNIKKIKEMIASGIWNTITRIGSLLSEGLDLLITNIFISPTDMGILSISKIVPAAINNVLNTLISTFMPNITELYAKEKSDELVDAIKQSMKIIGMIINIPIAILIAYGDILFSLWFPTQDAKLIQTLSIITIFPWAIMGQATIIHNIFTVLNKIKINSILVCLTGLLNVLVVYILLKITSLGLYAVAGVSSIFSVVRNLCYTVPFGAKYIGRKWNEFFPEIIKSICSVIAITIIGIGVRMFMQEISWISLIISTIITFVFGLGFNFYIVLSSKDRRMISSKVKKLK